MAAHIKFSVYLKPDLEIAGQKQCGFLFITGILILLKLRRSQEGNITAYQEAFTQIVLHKPWVWMQVRTLFVNFLLNFETFLVHGIV